MSSIQSEWAWVKTAEKDLRPMLWKVRRLCIQRRIPSGQQVAHAEKIAKQQLALDRKLNAMSYSEIWLLIPLLERI